MLARDVKIRKSFLYPVVGCAMLVYIYLEVTSRLASKPTFIAYNSNEELTGYGPLVSKRDVDSILRYKKLITDANRKQIMQNGGGELEISLIVVIQVHDKIYYLQQLVDSLKQARGISKVLLIFSHSYYNEEVNRVIWNITFATVLQIYYPYSVQLHPYVFPGNDQKICNEVMVCRSTYRKALINQHKHHWWWKASHVFDKVHATKRYNGSVLFLEENQYVTKDFIYIFKVLEGLLSSSNPRWDAISLGADRTRQSGYRAKNTTIILKQLTTKETIGIAFNRDTWKTIKSLSDQFCRYNDNRWYKSLIYLASKTLPGKFYVLSVESSRVFRFSKCNSTKSCSAVEKVDQVQTFLSKIQKGLFPYKMHIVQDNSVEEVGVGNGGWSDVRDHELCLYFTRKISL